MKPSGITTVTRWSDHLLATDDDLVAGECAVALTYNRHPHVVMMATPADLPELGVGFSLSEGLARHPDEIVAARVIEREQGVELALTVSADCLQRVEDRRRNLVGRTGCGLCGAESLEQVLDPPPPVGHTLRVTHAAIQSAVAGLVKHQPLQAATGAVHCAAWSDVDGGVVAAREDVGRHNALDKLVGWRAAAGTAAVAGFVVVSSRASYEMVYKCAMAGVELLVAVSAPTTLAIEFARHCGMTLVGFARPGRHNLYTHPERVSEGSPEDAR